jgi:hypothetical protein
MDLQFAMATSALPSLLIFPEEANTTMQSSCRRRNAASRVVSLDSIYQETMLIANHCVELPLTMAPQKRTT